MAGLASTVPANSVTVSSLPGHIRTLQAQLRTTFNLEHESLTDSADGGVHSSGSAVAYEDTSEPPNRPDGSTALADNAIDRGRLWLDDNFDPPQLKRWDGSAWEVIIGHVVAADAPALVVESEEDANTAGAMDSYLKFRGFKDAAGDCDLAHIKVAHSGTSDDQKGYMSILLNAGTDDNAPASEAIRFLETGKVDSSESAAISTDTGLAEDDDDLLASQKAIKAYADTKQAAITTYDSGWFAVNKATLYSKAHGLGAVPTIVQVWYSDTSDGTGDVVLTNSPGDATGRQICVVDCDATNIKIYGKTTVIDYYDSTGSRNYPNSGYAKIVAILIP